MSRGKTGRKKEWTMRLKSLLSRVCCAAAVLTAVACGGGKAEVEVETTAEAIQAQQEFQEAMKQHEALMQSTMPPPPAPPQQQ
jgi:hypothetical protein